MTKPKPKSKSNSVDAYLAALPIDQRATLEKLRRTIRAVVPQAEECISYQIPAFRYAGRLLVGFGAAASHCAFYPMSSTAVAAHEADLKRFDTSKGTIRFQPDAPVPVALVRKLVKARLAENARRRPRI